MFRILKVLKLSSRNQKIRRNSLRKFWSQFLTDDEWSDFLGFEGSRIRPSAFIYQPENLKLGKNVWIGDGAYIDASGGLEIDDNCTISCGAQIWTHTSVKSNILGKNQINSPHILRMSTKIGSNVYIGGPCNIYPGITIESNVVVLPMSVVNSDLKEGYVYGGIPARAIKKIQELDL